jgi:hypothetical protein
MEWGVLYKLWAFLITELFNKGVSEAMRKWRVSRENSGSAEMVL